MKNDSPSIGADEKIGWDFRINSVWNEFRIMKNGVRSSGSLMYCLKCVRTRGSFGRMARLEGSPETTKSRRSGIWKVRWQKKRKVVRRKKWEMSVEMSGR
jgi:hypothetical protein